MTDILLAQWVLPIVSRPIENGAVAIDDSNIVGVGEAETIIASFPDASCHDFGKAAILPGLINCHSHLELTVMRGLLDAEEHDFFRWLKKLGVSRHELLNREDLFVSAVCGAIEAARGGITCLGGDASDEASASHAALREVGLRGIVYQEVFGPDTRIATEKLQSLQKKIREIRELDTKLVRIGVSPHAPYTVSPLLLNGIVEYAVAEQLPILMHAAESKFEVQFMHHGSGAFADGLRARKIDFKAPGCSTIEYLAKSGVLSARPLLAHCIHVNEDDMKMIRESGASVAHCPKSNAKFGHPRAPLSAFIKNKIPFGIGSDSVASNNTCDMIEEGRFAALIGRIDSETKTDAEMADAEIEVSTISADLILHAMTSGGARAIKMEDKIGSLQTGFKADITVIDLSGCHQQPVYDPVSAIVFASSARDVMMTMVDGCVIYRNDKLALIDEASYLARINRVKQKLT